MMNNNAHPNQRVLHFLRLAFFIFCFISLPSAVHIILRTFFSIHLFSFSVFIKQLDVMCIYIYICMWYTVPCGYLELLFSPSKTFYCKTSIHQGVILQKKASGSCLGVLSDHLVDPACIFLIIYFYLGHAYLTTKFDYCHLISYLLLDASKVSVVVFTLIL